jgi:hypothetical protein
MEGQIDLFTLLAMIVAVIAVLKLRSVLGKRTDEDDARIERRAREEVRNPTTAGAGSDKVVTLPRRDREDAAAETRVDTVEADNRVREFAKGDETVAEGLFAIRKLDPDFDPGEFIDGARQAYEIIVTSFAEGNKKALRDLLSKDVLEGFTGAISEREAEFRRHQQGRHSGSGSQERRCEHHHAVREPVDHRDARQGRDGRLGRSDAHHGRDRHLDIQPRYFDGTGAVQSELAAHRHARRALRRGRGARGHAELGCRHRAGAV